MIACMKRNLVLTDPEAEIKWVVDGLPHKAGERRAFQELTASRRAYRTTSTLTVPLGLNLDERSNSTHPWTHIVQCQAHTSGFPNHVAVSKSFNVTVYCESYCFLTLLIHIKGLNLTVTILRLPIWFRESVCHLDNIGFCQTAPPSEPIIDVSPANSYIHANSSITLTCSTIGGHPQPTIKWYQDGNKVRGAIVMI